MTRHPVHFGQTGPGREQQRARTRPVPLRRHRATPGLLALALLLHAFPLGSTAQITNPAAARPPAAAPARAPQPPTPVRPPSTPVQPARPPGTIPPGVITFGPGGTIQLQPGQPGAPGSPGIDPLLNLMLQQPSIDIESAATVLAEFDPPVIPVGGRATYRIVVTALNEVITLPESLPAPAPLQLVPGGRGQAFFTLGNKMQPRTTINYRATATGPGNYVIPPFSVTVSGKLIQVPSARLQVVPPGSAPVRAVPKLAVKLPEGDIYVGQTVPIQVMLSDPDGSSVRGLARVEITTEGFLVDSTFYRQRREIINIDGKPTSALAQEMFVTPIKAGDVQLIAQAQAILMPSNPVQSAQLPGYYPLLDADPVPVTIKRLPKEGELPGFTGGIGTFTLEQPKLSTNQVRAGDPVTLTLTVKGQGNLARLIPPKLDGLWEWQTFEPTSDSSQAAVVQQRGFSTFNYTLIPLSEQITSTPRIPFSYFDPARKAYVDLTVPPVPITVQAPPGGVRPGALASGPGARGDEPGERGERNTVMNGLAEAPGVMAWSLIPLQHRAWFIVFQFVPALALGGLWLWDRRRRFLALHPEVRLKRRARRGLRRHQRALRRAAIEHDAQRFVWAAINALRQACAPHGAANPDALVCADILQVIPVPARDGQAGDAVRRVFSAADSLQFGGVLPDGPQLLGLRPELERVLDQLRAKL